MTACRCFAAPALRCAIASSDPKCFSQVVVDGHLLTTTETYWRLFRVDRPKRSAVVPGAAAVLAFFFHLDHVGRLHFRTTAKERGFSILLPDALNVVSSFVLHCCVSVSSEIGTAFGFGSRSSGRAPQGIVTVA